MGRVGLNRLSAMEAAEPLRRRRGFVPQRRPKANVSRVLCGIINMWDCRRSWRHALIVCMAAILRKASCELKDGQKGRPPEAARFAHP